MMESPYYEMTHDIQTENEISKTSYQTGYLKGYQDGHTNLLKLLTRKTDEELLKWKHDYIQVEVQLTKLINDMLDGSGINKILEEDKK